ncbi:MAG: hypothetical protein U5O39_19390 [Gammaproteobacteria bacterium]|nr:hypothetical protein [Gammaproteobacteria bacterium]
MLLYSVALLAGFLVLFKSADLFVIGSVATANNLKISPMIIGLTVVALGTSAPEIFVGVAASLKQQADLVVGNAIGSNIANIGMVLGITAIIVPPMPTGSPRKGYPYPRRRQFSALGVVLFDNRLELLGWRSPADRPRALYYSYRDGVCRQRIDRSRGKMAEDGRNSTDIDAQSPYNARPESRLPAAVSGSAGVGSRANCQDPRGQRTLHWPHCDRHWHEPAGTRRLRDQRTQEQSELAIGNIIGSNIFNLLAVLSIPSLLAPQNFSPDIFLRDYGTMMGMTAATRPHGLRTAGPRPNHASRGHDPACLLGSLPLHALPLRPARLREPDARLALSYIMDRVYQKPDWRRESLNNRTLIIVASILLVGIATNWLIGKTEEDAMPDAGPGNDPDLYMKGAKITQFDEDGAPSSTLQRPAHDSLPTDRRHDARRSQRPSLLRTIGR